MNHPAPDYPATYYAASAPIPPVRPVLVGDHRVDVAILGAGLTGLGAALALAEQGLRVAVIEACRVGWGASGRNGGQIIPGFTIDLADLVARHGKAEARILAHLAAEGETLLRERIARHAIDCDLVWGHVTAALKPRHMAGLEADIALRGQLGLPQPTLWSRDQLAARVHSERYIGGLYDRSAGHLHPLRYVLGLAAAVEGRGGVIYESSAVRRFDPGDIRRRARLDTDHGRIEADHLLLCGNAYLRGIASQAEQYAMSAATYMIATESLSETKLADCLSEPLAVSDCNFILDYFRPSSDRRVLFGALADYRGRDPGDIAAKLRPRLLRVFPQLQAAGIEFAWSGLIAVTRSRMPHLGRIGPRTLFAHGYSGHGLVLTGLAGNLLAEVVMGRTDRFDQFAKLPHKPVPNGKFAPAALRFAKLYYSLKDRL